MLLSCHVRVSEWTYSWLNGWLFVYELGGCGFESRCCQLKVTLSFLCFWINQVYMFLSQRNIFANSPRWIFTSSRVDFDVSPMESLLLDFTPENVWKLDISSSRAVLTRVLRRSVEDIWFKFELLSMGVLNPYFKVSVLRQDSPS